MIGIEVNGVDVEIADVAFERLNALMIKFEGLMCNQSSVAVPNWGCTRVRDHKGPHVAHGFDDCERAETYAVFVEADLTTVLFKRRSDEETV